MPASFLRTARSPDRALYGPAAIVICALVVIGFGRTYFYRPFRVNADSLTPLVHVHGALMTAWFALFIVQVALVAFGRTDLHRRVGRLGFLLLPLILAVAIPTTLVATKLGGDHMPGPALPGLALVIGLLISFATLAGVGLHYRTRSDVHKRLMLLASISAMEAGVSRLPLEWLDSVARIHLLNDSVLLIAVIIDTVRHRRLHPAFLWGSVFLVSTQTLFAWISGTSAWLSIAGAIMKPFM
jgi:hypothetical protein